MSRRLNPLSAAAVLAVAGLTVAGCAMQRPADTEPVAQTEATTTVPAEPMTTTAQAEPMTTTTAQAEPMAPATPAYVEPAPTATASAQPDTSLSNSTTTTTTTAQAPLPATTSTMPADGTSYPATSTNSGYDSSADRTLAPRADRN